MNVQTIIGLGLFVGIASPALAAMPVVPVNSGSDVITVAGGCGLGWHRGPYGGCRRNYYYGGPGVVVVRPHPYWGHCWRGYYGHLHCN